MRDTLRTRESLVRVRESETKINGREGLKKEKRKRERDGEFSYFDRGCFFYAIIMGRWLARGIDHNAESLDLALCMLFAGSTVTHSGEPITFLHYYVWAPRR